MLNCDCHLLMCHHGPLISRYGHGMVSDALTRLRLRVAGCEASAVQKKIWPGHVRGDKANALRNIVPPYCTGVFGCVGWRDHIATWL